MKLLIILLFTLPVLAQDSAFDPTDNSLTLEEEQAAQDYMHEGLAQSKYNEMCVDENGRLKDICMERQQAFDGTMGVIEMMMPAVSKAYAMFPMMGMMSGGGQQNMGALTSFNAKMSDPNGDPLYTVPGQDKAQAIPEGQEIPEGAERQTEQKKDYCGFIAMVGEGANTAMVTMQNARTQQNFQLAKGEARQAASFYALAENEKTMRKGANLNFYTWTGTASCYAVYAAQAQFQGDWKVYAKLSASGLIALFYKKKADAHKKREEMLRQMARELPGAGDCNPYTATTCFCNEPTSGGSDPANFQKYCIPDELALGRPAGSDPTPCIDANGRTDMACKCKKNNTCIDRRLSVGGVDIGLQPLSMRDPLASLKPFSSGFNSGNLDRAADRNLAIANKAIKDFAPDNLGNITAKQKKEARGYASLGIPTPAAIALAKSPGGSGRLPPGASMGGGGLAASTGKKFKSDSQQKIATMSPKFDKQKSAGGSGKMKNPFARFKKKTSKRTSTIDIENFAKKAREEAEITPHTGRGIFEIISYRYKASAWKEFSDQIKTKQTQE